MGTRRLPGGIPASSARCADKPLKNSQNSPLRPFGAFDRAATPNGRVQACTSMALNRVYAAGAARVGPGPLLMSALFDSHVGCPVAPEVSASVERSMVNVGGTDMFFLVVPRPLGRSPVARKPRRPSNRRTLGLGAGASPQIGAGGSFPRGGALKAGKRPW
jgi:hypothetical protein